MMSRLEIIDKLITSFKNCFSCFIKDHFFTATAAFLDTKLHVNEDCEELYEKSVPIIVSCYSQQLVAKWMGFNCLKASATSSRQFTFYHKAPRYSWYSFYRPWKDERLSRPWSHTVVLNARPLDRKSSDAIDLFLTEFPDDTVRKCPHHVDRHNYRKKRNVNEKEQNESTSTSNKTPSSVVDLSLPSDSEFSESEDEM